MAEIIYTDPRTARLQRMRRSVLTTARLFQTCPVRRAHRYRVAMLTLTYREEVEWCASHVRDLLGHIRKHCARLGVRVRYLWVAELTKRGRMHYHILFWLPKGLTLPKPDKRGWWPHGSTRIEWAKKAVGYIAKYASKADPLTLWHFPKGARISGSSSLDFSDACCRRWWLLPQWARSAFAPSDDLRRAPGGGWVTSDGEWMPSPFELAGRPEYGVVPVRQVLPLPTPRLDHIAACPLMPRALSGLDEARF